MSTRPWCAEAPTPLGALKALIDPACWVELVDELRRPRGSPPPLDPAGRVVLGGHRAAGKSRLLPWVSQLLGRPGLDLDAQLERAFGRHLCEWFAEDPKGFRLAERRLFAQLPRGVVAAVGGGFFSLHADLLEGHLAVEVPVSFDTYRRRLLADRSRPRLRPELSIEEELRAVWVERSLAHARLRPLSLGAFLRDHVGLSA